MPFMTITLLYCTVLLQMHVHSYYSRPTGRHGSILGSPQTRQVSFSFSSSYHSTSISLQQSSQVPHVKGRSTRKVWGWIRHDWLRLSNCCVQRNATAWRSQLPEVLHRPILQMRVIVKNYCTVQDLQYNKQPETDNHIFHQTATTEEAARCNATISRFRFASL